MQGKDENRKEKAISYVSGLISGEGKSWPETPKLILPDDVYGSIVDLCRETGRGRKIGTLRIGELAMQPYYPNTPELEAEYHDPESKYWKYVRDKLLGTLQKNVGDKMNWYGMLRPVSVAPDQSACPGKRG